MSVTEQVGRQAIRVTNQIVNTAVLVVILLLLTVGCYAIWDTNQVYSRAEATRYADYEPSSAAGVLSFQELQAINPEVISWVVVFGTQIDYPVTQGPDNVKYLNTDAKGEYSLSGSIFLDYENSPDFSDFNSILFGHHMNQDAMFGDIGLFEDKSYFDAREYGTIYYNGQEHGIEFFALVQADAYDEVVYRPNVLGWQNQQNYLDLLTRDAIQTRNSVSVTPNDRIVLLSTCSESATNGRDILVGKITDDVRPNPFGTGPTDDAKTNPAASPFQNLWERQSLPVKIVLAGAPIALIALAVVLVVRKRSIRRSLEEMRQQAMRGTDEHS